MPERENDDAVSAQPREDVDDLIFRADPGWLVSDR